MIKNICLSLAVSTALITGSAQAVNDYFIKIDGIAGTSFEKGLTDYIPVESWSLGFNRGVCQALQFAKKMDSSSADLTGAALSGIVYPNIVLVARKQGEVPFTFMRLTLTNSVFKSFKTGGTTGESLVPIEQISAQPSSVKTELYDQDRDGRRVLIATSSVVCPQT